ncbi:thioredoxin family protein [Robiginitomaculum antarcticum]|uniref:thioredoxin family protein n=1 Tax=Robiginitomaculum antarcticum TaxID=437507 RepID=UPI00036913B8|nr:thioredoxin family protein [Robiginitomaculum antarcticum]
MYIRIFAIALAIGLTAIPVTKVLASDNDEPRPYHSTRNASQDVEAAFDRAALRGTRVLLVMGANWCHDSRGLAARLEQPEFSSLIDLNYELVYVDVGQRNRNIDIAKRYGIENIVGTPTVLILTSDGVLLNRDTAPTWRDAASRTDEETLTYFTAFASGDMIEEHGAQE